MENRRDALKGHFDTLTAAAAARRQQLEDSRAYHKFLLDAKEEEAWMRQKLPEATSQDLGSTLTAVHNNQSKHNALTTELNSRQKKSVADVAAQGRALIEANNVHSPEIADNLKLLKDRWDNLKAAASARDTALKGALQSQQYFVEANEAESWMTEKEQQVASDDLGKDEYSAQRLLSKQQASNADIEGYAPIMKDLGTQADVASQAPVPKSVNRRQSMMSHDDLNRSATDLVSEEPMVKVRFDYTARRTKELTVAKGEVLRLVAEKDENWWKVARGDAVGYVPAKYVKKLPQSAPSPSKMSTPMASSSSQLHLFPDPTVGIKERQAELDAQYDALRTRAAQRERSLSDAASYFFLKREGDELLDWLQEHKPVYATRDVGATVEQVELIQKTFDNFKINLASQQPRKTKFDETAQQLLAQQHQQSADIDALQKQVDEEWNAMTDLVAARDKQLGSAFEVERFHRDASETTEWMREKNSVMTEDLGRDVSSVEALRRAHAAFERDLQAIVAKENSLRGEADDLKSRHQDEASRLDEDVDTVATRLKELQESSRERKKLLDEALDFQRFVTDARSVDAWVDSTVNDIHAVETPVDVASAEAVCDHHAGLKLEIEARRQALAEIRQRGIDMLEGGHHRSEDIANQIADIDGSLEALDKAWTDRDSEHKQTLDLRKFESAAERARTALDRQEAHLQDRDVGDSVDSASRLLKLHDAFDQRLQAQGDEIANLNAQAKAMLEYNHPQANAIASTQRDINDRRAAVEAGSADRRHALEDSVKLLQYVRDTEESLEWMREKDALVKDIDWEDRHNLKSKLQAHTAVNDDIQAYEPTITELRTTSVRLQQENPAAAGRIADQQAKVDESWTDLNKASKDKLHKLDEYVQEQAFQALVEDFDEWHAQIEKDLAQTDLGGNRIAANQLLKQHRQLQQDVQNKQVDVDRAQKAAKVLLDAGNFRSQEIKTQLDQMQAKYAALQAPVDSRLANLEASAALQSFLADCRDELAWVDERMPRAEAQDKAADLDQAENMHRQHRHFNAEVDGHMEIVDIVKKQGQDLVSDGHYAKSDIESQIAEVDGKVKQLSAASEARLASLAHSEQAHRFFVDANEAEQYIQQLFVSANNDDFGSDSERTQMLLSKQAALQVDVEAHSEIVAGLYAQGQDLIKANNPDASAIESRSEEVLALQEELQAASKQRAHLLKERKQLHDITQMTEDSIAWMEIQKRTASNTEIGRDQDDCAALVDKHDAFKTAVISSKPEQVDAIVKVHQECVADKHSDVNRISECATNVQAEWQDLSNLIDQRSVQLDKAREIHSFNQETDELLLRLQEKTLTASSTDYGRDLGTADTFSRTHGVLVNEVNGLEPAVSRVLANSKALQARHPESQDILVERARQIEDQWKILNDKTTLRTTKLAESLRLQRFLSQQRQFQSWLEACTTSMDAIQPPHDLTRAATLVEEHNALKAEIDGEDSQFKDLCKEGRSIAHDQPDDANIVNPLVEQLEAKHASLLTQWSQTDDLLDERYDDLKFEHDASLAAKWLNGRSKLLTSSELETQDPELALQMQLDLEASIMAQEQRFAQLRRLTKQEQKSLDDDKRNKHFARFEEEDKREQQARTEVERKRQAAEAAEKHRRDLLAQQQAEMEESMRKRRAEEANQRAAEENQKAQALCKALLERESERTSKYQSRLQSARSSSSVAQQESRRRSSTVVNREQRAETARKRASTMIETVLEQQRKPTFLPQPAMVAADADMSARPAAPIKEEKAFIAHRPTSTPSVTLKQPTATGQTIKSPSPAISAEPVKALVPEPPLDEPPAIPGDEPPPIPTEESREVPATSLPVLETATPSGTPPPAQDANGAQPTSPANSVTSATAVVAASLNPASNPVKVPEAKSDVSIASSNSDTEAAISRVSSSSLLSPAAASIASRYLRQGSETDV
eukprot:TRINITY_DN12085_c4_g1_i2.p1 TRINITY_DN12085_c4_g1~~TRINITY_DN12085_c4_g1_i2.p1  ORF type:complete len:2147 (+),score=711.68 TRINITY_DN12085_c4_g1_i2:659-6442(+)